MYIAVLHVHVSLFNVLSLALTVYILYMHIDYVYT